MLSTSLDVSQPVDIPQLRTFCLSLYPINLNGLFDSLVSSFLSSLYTLDIMPLPDVELVKIFSHFVGCPFCFLDNVFSLT